MTIAPQSGQPLTKPSRGAHLQPRKRRRRTRAQKGVAVRTYCFARDCGICRCCRVREAESLHEIRPRSLGGKVTRQNSIALCGSGTTGCHGYCQSYRVRISGGPEMAEGTLVFTALNTTAARWLRIAVGASVESPVLRPIETEAF